MSRWMESLTCLVLGLAPLGAAPATDPPQVPLCMIGDSITWADQGDCWRRELLKHLPNLAFVGTHSARFGYSHAGEGGNSTARVLGRLADIPDCPNYSLLIGTNDNSIKDETKIEAHAAGTAARIVKIVEGLLAKPSCRKVLVSSVLPCFTDNPLRDRTNAATNRHLRPLLAALPADRVAYVDYETIIRATPDWEPLIKLHPTPEGYQLLAQILADALVKELGLTRPIAAPVPAAGAGVKVHNLWAGGADGVTDQPIIAGWYTLSFDLVAAGPAPVVTVVSADSQAAKQLAKSFSLKPAAAGTRVEVELFTEYEGYGYTRSPLALKLTDCQIARILLEKKRPSGKASTYGEGVYLDTLTPPAPGELVELP
ncbi:MAG: SGNH/GDSL hydrolase family protein [Armatimonadetes bacterium]|nr:SGNH/GDSL hydrolase family protein [Armatimonadota bacterium]